MKKQIPLVLDIGTEAIKAGFLKNTAIHYYDRFGSFSGRDPGKEMIKKAISEALEEVQGKEKAKTKDVLVGLPPGALKVRTSYQALERKNSREPISQKEAEKIQQDIFKKGREKIGEIFFQEAGISLRDLAFLDEFSLGTKIDGYSVPRLVGYRGKRVGAAIFSVFSPKNYLEKFRRIFKDLNLEVLKISHPGQYLPKLFKDINEGIFIDVGGEVTQVFIVKNNNLSEIFDFPIGGRDFSKALSRTIGLSEEKARLFKESYAHKETTEETRARIHEIFSEVAEDWFFGLRDALRRFTGLRPSEIRLFGGGSQLPEISEILENLAEQRSPQILKDPQLINLTLISYAQ